MKINAFLFTVVICIIGALNFVSAQPRILNEVLQLHNAQPNYSARSAAVGGAFTSLGADVVSFYQNPAGLALYRSSEVFYGPGLSFKNTGSNFSQSKSGRSNFLFEGGSGGLLITSKRDRSKLKFINYGFAFHSSKSNNFTKTYKGLDEYTDNYGNDIVLELEETITTKKSRYTELAFALAANYDDKFLFGLNITTPKYTYNQRSDFTERDINNLFYSYERIFTETDSIITNSSINIGFGIIYKITNNLRLGVNAKSSSLVTLQEEISSSLVEIDDYGDAESPDSEFEQYFYVLNTAPQFNAGLSYLNQKGFISVDVGYILNKRIRYFNENLTEEGWFDYNAEINELLKNSVVFRVGAEYVPAQSLRLRAGYNLTTSPVQNNRVYSGTHSLSVGAGVRKAVFETETSSRTVFADAALKYSFYQSEYEIFGDIENSPFVDFNYHQLQLITTFGFKFWVQQFYQSK